LALVDKPDTELAEKAWANQATIRLYDPAVGGKTPADGAGLPATSVCYLRDRDTQFELGFTTDVVGWDTPWQTLGDFVVAPGTMFTPQAVAPLEEEAPPEPEKPERTIVTRRTR
jgi:hypothetical protein